MRYVTDTTLEGINTAREYALANVIGLTAKDIFGYEHDAAAINVKVQFTDMTGETKQVTVNTLDKKFVV